MKKVSIIMTVYNCELYVSKAIHSIQEQTFSDFELIIVDDGSSDGTLEVVQKNAILDNRIIVIGLKHTGISGARMAGLSQASGEWIMYIDGDDLLNPYILEEYIKLAEKENADIVQGKNDNFIDDDEITNEKPSEYLKYHYMKGQDVIGHCHEPNITFRIEAGPWGKIIKRKLFEHHDIVDWIEKCANKYPINYFNDFSMIPRLICNAEKILFVDYLGYHHRDRNDSVSRTFKVTRTHFERCELLADNIIYFKNRDLFNAIDSHIVNYFLLLLSFWYKGRACGLKSEEFIEYTKQLQIFYKDNYIYLMNKNVNASLLQRVVIKLWIISPYLWEILVGNFYFKLKYKR
jgi:glycosyltransferase involved in cell wall biosynthesis